MRNFNEYLGRKRQEYGNKFNPSCLADQFKPYYESGARIEVEFHYGEKKRGTIGVTTGWQPCFLLMLTARSRGSSYTLSGSDKVCKVVK